MGKPLNKAEMPERCPTCNLNWQYHEPAKVHGSDMVRCIECKDTFPTTPTDQAIIDRLHEIHETVGVTPELRAAKEAYDKATDQAELEVVAWRIGNKFDGEEVIWTYFDGGDDVNVSRAVPLCDGSQATTLLAAKDAEIERVNALALDQVSDLTIRAETAEAEVKRLTEENEGLTQNAESLLEINGVHKASIKALEEQVEQAFKDGVEYATIVDVPNSPEGREQAWSVSRARAFLKGSSQEPNP